MGLHLEVAGERGPEGGENFMDGVKEAEGEVDGCGDRGQRHDCKSMQILYKEALGDLS